MKIKQYKTAIACSLLSLLVMGCVKNETHFYDDPQATGLSIFSNTGSNVFSCYLNNTAWRTEARISGGFLSQPHYEVYIRKQYFDSLIDVLSIEWYGSYFGDPSSSPAQISLYMYVPKNFNASDFSALQGKRLTIDSTIGYFFAATSPNYSRGYGTIYFNIATFDPAIGNGRGGRMSGLVEADFGSIKLTSGRFDHILETGQVFIQ